MSENKKISQEFIELDFEQMPTIEMVNDFLSKFGSYKVERFAKPHSVILLITMLLFEKIEDLEAKLMKEKK